MSYTNTSPQAQPYAAFTTSNSPQPYATGLTPLVTFSRQQHNAITGKGNTGPNNVITGNQNPSFYCDAFHILSFDQSLISYYDIGGTVTPGDQFGLQLTVDGQTINVYYTMQSGDTLLTALHGLQSALVNNPAIIQVYNNHFDGSGLQIGHFPSAGVLGTNRFSHDVLWGLGNDVQTYTSPGATVTFVKELSSGNTAEVSPYMSVSRHIPGRTPVDSDIVVQVRYVGQSSNTTQGDTYYGMIRTEVAGTVVATNGFVAAGQDVITLNADVPNVQIGWLVADKGSQATIPSGTTVIAINHGTLQVTLSNEIGSTGLPNGANISFVDPANPVGQLALMASNARSSKSAIAGIMIQNGVMGATTDGTGTPAGNDPGYGNWIIGGILACVGGFQVGSFGGPNAPTITAGVGAPSNSPAPPPASLYLRTGGTAGNNNLLYQFDPASNTYIPYTMTLPSSPIALVATGKGGAVTGTATETNLAAIKVPANTLGANGRVELEVIFTYPSSANNKVITVRLNTTSGAVSGGNIAVTGTFTTTQQYRQSITLQNQGATNSQVISNISSGASATAVVTASLDTTADFYINVNAAPAGSGETITLVAYRAYMVHA